MADVVLSGNMTATPELRFTQSGVAVTNFTVAENRKYTNRAGDEVEEVIFWRVNCWKTLAENAADSLSKGDRVIVHGQLKQNDFTDKEGVERRTIEITAWDVAPSLLWARATVERNEKKGGGGGGHKFERPTDDYGSEPFVHSFYRPGYTLPLA